MTAFIERAGVMGADEVRLTTDKDHNNAVNRFYLRMGFAPVATQIAGPGRTKNIYKYEIDAPGPDKQVYNPEDIKG